MNPTSTSVPIPAIAGPMQLFNGDHGTPFLAPRGVCLTENHLIVADTGQNRVFIWNNRQHMETHRRPDVVLGQSNTSGTARNQGNAAGPATLQYPSGIWSDGNLLLVADAWNHRVLIWRRMPLRSDQAADVVIGQPDFEANQPNVSGLGKPPSARSLYWPYGVWSDGQRIWIADTGNRRALYYENIPDQNFAPADAVIGKPDFTTRDYEHTDAVWPYSVKISASGAMAITDTQYYRVLGWNHWKDSLHRPADWIIGQDDFESNGMNRYQLQPQSNSLNWCYDAHFFESGLLVADTGNSRILWYPELPDRHGMEATSVIGPANFTTGSENEGTRFGTENALYWPFSVSLAGNRLALADTGNHRIVFYDLNQQQLYD